MGQFQGVRDERLCVFCFAFFMQGCDNSLFDNPWLDSSYKEFETDRERLKNAIRNNNLIDVKAVVEKENSYVNAIVSDRYQERPIHVAAYYGRDKIVEYLVSNGANVNETDLSGMKTALLIAIWKRHESTALLLLKLGADPNITTNGGATACRNAKRAGFVEVVRAIPGCELTE